MVRNKWSLRSRSARIPPSPWLHWKWPCRWCQLRCVFPKPQLLVSGKVPWILWLLLLPCDLFDQSQHLSDAAWKYPGLLFIAFKRLLVIMGCEGMELIELYRSNLWIRIAIFICLDRAIFLHKSSYLNT